METNYFEELVEFYNELLEDTRWKQAVRAGELSGKAISTLRKKNIIPKQKRMLRGIETGTKNILKKSNATITQLDPRNKKNYKKQGAAGKKMRKIATKRPELLALSHPSNLSSPSRFGSLDTGKVTRVTVPTKDSIKNRFKKAIIDRHEADEAREIAKDVAKKRKEKRGTNNGFRIQFMKHHSKSGGEGAHMSASVIAKERKTADFLTNAYGKNTEAGKGVKMLNRYRNRTLAVDVPGKTEYEVAGSKKLQDTLRRRQNRRDRRAARDLVKTKAQREELRARIEKEKTSGPSFEEFFKSRMRK